MRTLTGIFGGAIIAVAVTVAGAAAAEERREADWPSFRGPGASGIGRGPPPPIEWNVAKSENLRWKAGIPGLGHSSPAIGGNRIFVTAAVRPRGDGKREAEEEDLRVGLYGDVDSVDDASERAWYAYALDKDTGRILWEELLCQGVPKVKRHPKSTHANSSPATDGKHVVVLLGSEGLYCLDAEGKVLWEKDLGLLDSGFYVAPGAQWGFGSSPVIHEGLVIVQCDVQKGSFLAAIDVRTGKEVWKTPRDEVPTWSTPTVYSGQGRAQIVVNGFKHIGGYDLATGKEIWRLKGGGDIPVPTPIAAHGLFFITSAHGATSPIFAVRSTAKGEIAQEAGEHMAWSTRRYGNYMQTPIVWDDLLYLCADQGILSCYRAKTGERLYRERLGKGGTGFTASPVAAAGLLYFTSEEGEVYVVKAGAEFRLLARNELGETCMATPAISEGVLFFRTRHHLVAIGHPARRS